MKALLIATIPTLFCSSIFYLFNNQELFSVFLLLFGVYFSIGAFFVSKKDEDYEADKIKPTEEDWTSQFIIIDQDLNHKNLLIRKFKRNENKSELFEFEMYLSLFWIFYVFTLMIKDFNLKDDNLIKKFANDLFHKTPITNYLYKNKNIIIDTKIITENKKNLDVTYFLNGTIEYRYKGQLHRENEYPAITCDSEDSIVEYQTNAYYLFGVKYEQHEMEKQISKLKIKNF